MMKRLMLTISVLLIQGIYATTWAQPSLPTIIPPAPDIAAKAYVLMDANSGKILAQKNMHKHLPPASLTKMMTLYIAEQNLAQKRINLDDKTRVSKNAWKRGGSRLFLKPGSFVTVKDLMRGIIVASGNDACVALAEYLAGNESSFAHLMNGIAERLGMKESHFTDSTGLPHPNHYSTPYDLALLAQHLIIDFPQYYHFFGEKWITYNKIRQPNRNLLLWRDPSVDGIKTGHTQAAGFCLVASAKRNQMRLISVVMGTADEKKRASTSQALLNWGFRFYESHRIVEANHPLKHARVWMGKSKKIALGVAQDLYVTVPTGEASSLHAQMSLPQQLKAPITEGATYGEITVTLRGKPIATAPLIALKSDEVGGLWTRMTDRVLLFFKKFI